MTGVWGLPEGFDELAPAEARALEALRRRLLDLQDTWGYQQVSPPFLEYLESLSLGSEAQLDVQMFKVVDQLSGRMLALRADMTPQVARMAASLGAAEAALRLCYCGTVLRTRPDSLAGNSRSPIQFGAELYGDSSVQSDAEIILLMSESLRTAGLTDYYIDIGHVGLYSALVHAANLSTDDEAHLFDMLQRKSRPEIEAWLNSPSSCALNSAERADVLALIDLNGDPSILEHAHAQLQSGLLKPALTHLQHLIEYLLARDPTLRLHVDLAELRGYRYHSGPVFAAYSGSIAQEIARGGRYDRLVENFGPKIPATGYSLDLRQLTSVANEARRVVYAGPDVPWDEIQRLRSAGEVVVSELGSSSLPHDVTHSLSLSDGAWQIREI